MVWRGRAGGGKADGDGLLLGVSMSEECRSFLLLSAGIAMKHIGFSHFRIETILYKRLARALSLLFITKKKYMLILSKVELVKIAPPFQLVEKTTNLLVNIHYFISSFFKTTN